LIKKVLVANRGEIARRVFRTCRDMGIATVAVFSDADSSAPFVSDAGSSVRLPGAIPAETYLRGDLIVEAAIRSGADAIHPGYGFLSENAEFAERCAAAGITFVGPPVRAIRTMGSKLESKRQMEDAGVPTLPSIDVTNLTDDQLAAAAAEIGYPVLVKASMGGGGKGMRIVPGDGTLVDAVASARRESLAAFGDETVFFERYLVGARHVEIQVFGDSFGDAVSLFERECSIQRRHQKIIEESPSTAVTSELRARISEAAVSAAKSVDYVGAGTVEFLLAADSRFYFLEMNTRLQVEHPVTEAVTGLDLVRAQLLVAGGQPLPDELVAARLSGHAIEARLYAEDPQNGYLPTTGTLQAFTLPTAGGLRADVGVEAGSTVSIHYDPMLAKVIAWAPTRAEASGKLAGALADAQIVGVTTNRDLLVRILRNDEFLAGQTDTGFLARNEAALLAPEDDQTRIGNAAAGALALQARERAAARVLPTLPSGWRNVPSQNQVVELTTGSTTVRVEYRFLRQGLHLAVDGKDLVARLWDAHPDLVDLEIDGIRRRYTIECRGDFVSVSGSLGASLFRLQPRLPDTPEVKPSGSLTAPMPAVVRSVLVKPGQRVAAGETLVILEAMKMEHPIFTDHAGVVDEVYIEVGDQISAGDTVLVVKQISA
jgi:propionyl-CoA carboxylase alpha chain